MHICQGRWLKDGVILCGWDGDACRYSPGLSHERHIQVNTRLHQFGGGEDCGQKTCLLVDLVDLIERVGLKRLAA